MAPAVSAEQMDQKGQARAGNAFSMPSAKQRPAAEAVQEGGHQQHGLYEPEWQTTISLAEEAVAVVTMLLLFGYVFSLPFLGPVLLYTAFVLRSPAALVLLALLHASTYLPAKRWLWFQRKNPVWTTWRKYFQLGCMHPSLPYCQPGKKYVFAHFPHSSFPMGSFLSLNALHEHGHGLPANTLGASASVIFNLPVLRHIMGWMGMLPAERKELLEALRSNGAVGVTPEGNAGIFKGADRQKERIFVKHRRGFIRLAMETGADLVPVYFLGQSQVLTFRGFCGLSRRLRMSIGVFWGRWGLPLPHRTHLIGLIGHPIPVGPPNPDPPQEAVDELHGKVVAALVELFDAHKHLMPGWEHKTLEIV